MNYERKVTKMKKHVISKKEALEVLVVVNGTMLKEANDSGVFKNGDDEEADNTCKRLAVMARALQVTAEALMDEGIIKSDYELVNRSFAQYSSPDEEVARELIEMASVFSVKGMGAALANDKTTAQTCVMVSEALLIASEIILDKLELAETETLEIE